MVSLQSSAKLQFAGYPFNQFSKQPRMGVAQVTSLERTTFQSDIRICLLFSGGVAARDEYRGKPLGKLSQLHHAVSGDVYVVDARTLHIKNFHYDGEGPGMFFFK